MSVAKNPLIAQTSREAEMGSLIEKFTGRL
jgi:hypothetical protein